MLPGVVMLSPDGRTRLSHPGAAVVRTGNLPAVLALRRGNLILM